jgi:tetratricopeptide (TPR) repeat protein
MSLLRLTLLMLAFTFTASQQRASGQAVEVDAGELTKRDDLVGKEVIVDDRLVYFQEHKGRGYDEITLKRTPALIRLPRRLRPAQQPNVKTIRLHGTLGHEGGRWTIDVLSWEGLPSELERLEKAVGALAPGDTEGRIRWGQWAETRGQAYHDDALVGRGRELAVEALRIEAEKPSADKPAHWLALAKSAKERGIEEPEPSSLVHRAFRELIERARSIEAAAPLPDRISEFLPASREPRPDAPTAWDAPYRRDPAKAYRSASIEARRTLDRRLLADAWQRAFELSLKENPAQGLKLADQADEKLPDRPEIAAGLRLKGINAISGDLGTLRQDEVQALANRLKVDLKDPERARKLLKDWLDDRRSHRLGASDSEGRTLLAALYESMLNDRRTAAELLGEAIAIDPESKTVADAYRRLGYLKVDGRWMAKRGEGGRAEKAQGEAEAPAGRSGELIGRGMTRAQVLTKLGGKPDRVVRTATQGQVLEQWIYQSERRSQVVNFVQRPGVSQPTVLEYYSIP